MILHHTFSHLPCLPERQASREGRLTIPVRWLLQVGLFSAFLMLLSHTSADAFRVNVSPSKIDPGDAFTIMISGAETSEAPNAFMGGKRVLLASCGDSCFIGIGAVDISTRPGIYKIEVHIGEKKVSRNLSVNRGRFPTKFLTLPEGKVFLSPEDSQRAEREQEKLDTIWSTLTDRLWEGNFVFPLKNIISTSFGVKRIMNRKKTSVHKGIDIKGKEGDEVKAANRGKVVLAEELFFGGNTVVLDHGQGIYTIYMHLSAFKVKQAETIQKGAVIGHVGSSGRSSGPHLHFGVKVMQVSANPASLVKLKL
ncbi:MAG TPA: M23 family metallopeptidase [Thermodesulfovibrionales bacterium]|nr:M23 family metallopeptidase [Thermodesulfovibrionales bacterium]